VSLQRSAGSFGNQSCRQNTGTTSFLNISSPDQTQAANFWDKAERTLLTSLFPNAFPYLTRYFDSLAKLVVRPQDFVSRGLTIPAKLSLF
jgi:hypothetical protein